MARVGAVYSLPPGYHVTSGEVIQPSQHNPPLEDIAQALTNSLARNGAGGMTGNLPMGSNRITGLGAPTAATDAVTKSYVDTMVTPTTIVRTEGAQSIAGRKTFTDFPVMAYPAVKMRFSDGGWDVDIRQGALFGFYNVNESVWMVSFDDEGLMNVPGGVSGPGGSLTGLNAGALTTGTVPDARLPATAVRTSVAVNTGDGLTGGGNLSASRTLAVDGTVVRTTREVGGGNGLTGGGPLTQDRIISLGTPSSITKNSTNVVTGSSHTHSISADDFRDMVSSWLRINIIGTPCLLRVNTGVTATPNQTLAASNFAGFTNASGDAAASTPVGTWVCLGYVGGPSNADRTSLFMRIT